MALSFSVFPLKIFPSTLCLLSTRVELEEESENKLICRSYSWPWLSTPPPASAGLLEGRKREMFFAAPHLSKSYVEESGEEFKRAFLGG